MKFEFSVLEARNGARNLWSLGSKHGLLPWIFRMVFHGTRTKLDASQIKKLIRGRQPTIFTTIMSPIKLASFSDKQGFVLARIITEF